jgi:hypothetical protein
MLRSGRGDASLATDPRLVSMSLSVVPWLAARLLALFALPALLGPRARP